MAADADRNGIRDDIDAFIEANYSETPAHKAAAKQVARSMQSLLDVNLEGQTDTQIQALLDDGGKAANCLHQVFGLADMVEVSRELEVLTYNTDARITKYLQMTGLSHGRSEWAPVVSADGTTSESCAP